MEIIPLEFASQLAPSQLTLLVFITHHQAVDFAYWFVRTHITLIHLAVLALLCVQAYLPVCMLIIQPAPAFPLALTHLQMTAITFVCHNVWALPFQTPIILLTDAYCNAQTPQIIMQTAMFVSSTVRHPITLLIPMVESVCPDVVTQLMFST